MFRSPISFFLVKREMGYIDVACYLHTLPMKLPDPQYVAKIKETFDLGMGK